MPPFDWFLLTTVSFVAALVQASTGFGFAIVAVPFYLIILGSLTAIQVSLMVTLVITVVIAMRVWHAAPPALLGRLVVGTLVGFPLGIVAYRHADLETAKLAVGLLITGFAAWLFLAQRGRPVVENPATHPFADVAIGIVSGAMTTSLGMPGPVILIYLSLLATGKEAMRATMLALFVFSNAGAIAFQEWQVGIDGATWTMAAILIPAGLVGAAVGHGVSRYLNQRTFRSAVLAILAATGLYMLWTSVT
ncbi:MAG: sulfite exporter TauE/SafE family protein [Rhodospirillales bacterium]|jgi:uncharacterized membrane protein YfcA|nr:sulfite exporter TauE/SafE family protein [Rhodospirillales bacterium]MDP6883809.1 sulfite exporter TauE/SafE family protein [Rhodospirillales bacterium]